MKTQIKRNLMKKNILFALSLLMLSPALYAQDPVQQQKELENELKNSTAPAEHDPELDAEDEEQVTTQTKVKKVAKPKKPTKRKANDWPKKRPDQIKQPPTLGNIPFQIGEHLVYKVNLLNAHAGTVTLRVGAVGTYQGQRVVELAGFIQSSQFLENFYPIRDSLVILVDEQTFLPVKSDFMVNEKGSKIEYQTKFNQKSGLVHWTKKTFKNGNRQRDEEFAAVSSLHDSLSSLYAIRRLKIEPGLHFEQYVWDQKRERLVEVKVVGEEKVLTDMGWIEAMKVEISSIITGGFISKRQLNGNKIKGTAWFAKDGFQTPVKLISPTRLGTAEVILTKKYIELPKNK
jgi:hypothetical protein